MAHGQSIHREFLMRDGEEEASTIRIEITLFCATHLDTGVNGISSVSMIMKRNCIMYAYTHDHTHVVSEYRASAHPFLK